MRSLKAAAKIPVHWVIIAISLWGMYLRFQFRHTHPLWRDETYQIEGMNAGLWGLVQWLSTHEFGTYISGDHYLIYPFYRIFSDNKWGLALPHIIATTLSFYVLYLIKRPPVFIL